MKTALRFISAVILLITVELLGAGCDSSTPMVALRTNTEPRQSIGVKFGHAYFGKSTNGEDQIVLVQEPIDELPHQPADQPLVRQTAPALSQVLVIKLHWGTAPSSSSDSPVANNAVLHWYVYGNPEDTGLGLLHYVGNGAVSFTVDQPTALVTIHSGDLTLQDRQGSLHDPFGSFKIDGSFEAKSDQGRMQQTMDDLLKVAADSLPSTQP